MKDFHILKFLFLKSYFNYNQYHQQDSILLQPKSSNYETYYASKMRVNSSKPKFNANIFFITTRESLKF